MEKNRRGEMQAYARVRISIRTRLHTHFIPHPMKAAPFSFNLFRRNN